MPCQTDSPTFRLRSALPARSASRSPYCQLSASGKQETDNRRQARFHRIALVVDAHSRLAGAATAMRNQPGTGRPVGPASTAWWGSLRRALVCHNDAWVAVHVHRIDMRVTTAEATPS